MKMKKDNSVNDPMEQNEDVLGENMKLLILHKEFRELTENKKEAAEEGKE